MRNFTEGLSIRRGRIWRPSQLISHTAILFFSLRTTVNNQHPRFSSKDMSSQEGIQYIRPPVAIRYITKCADANNPSQKRPKPQYCTRHGVAGPYSSGPPPPPRDPKRACLYHRRHPPSHPHRSKPTTVPGLCKILGMSPPLLHIIFTTCDAAFSGSTIQRSAVRGILSTYYAAALRCGDAAGGSCYTAGGQHDRGHPLETPGVSKCLRFSL